MRRGQVACKVTGLALKYALNHFTEPPSIVFGPLCHCTTLYIPVLQLCTFHNDCLYYHFFTSL